MAYEEHSTPIKTPRQLILVILAGFLIPIVTIILVAQLVLGGRSMSKDDPRMSPDAVKQRLQPVGQVAVKEASAPGAGQTGEQVVQTVCAACHATGALNAPKIGDKAAWEPRIKEGLDHLVQNAIRGIRQMPARGGNPDLTDAEVLRAVVLMANQSGASFKEPAAAAQSGAANPPGVGSAQGNAATLPSGTPAAPAPASTSTAAPAAPAAPAAKSGQPDGKAVFEAACATCHATGVAGAPKAGDKAAWEPRIKTGIDSLYNSALKGKGAMPAKGGNSALPDADVKAAVDYLVTLVR